MPNASSNGTTRRRFLSTAPAAASLALAARPLLAASAAELAADAKALQVKPGNNNLADFKSATVVMTTEVAHSAKEFEWHEQRDHIVQILDGATLYEVGGTPTGTHANPSGKSGEYLATGSEGATKYAMKKGDMLTIPRNTPHRRSTEGSVTFILISAQGMMM
jgi:quercetin dioxygenase-like cupin family protein